MSQETEQQHKRVGGSGVSEGSCSGTEGEVLREHNSEFEASCGGAAALVANEKAWAAAGGVRQQWGLGGGCEGWGGRERRSGCCCCCCREAEVRRRGGQKMGRRLSTPTVCLGQTCAPPGNRERGGGSDLCSTMVALLAVATLRQPCRRRSATAATMATDGGHWSSWLSYQTWLSRLNQVK